MGNLEMQWIQRLFLASMVFILIVVLTGNIWARANFDVNMGPAGKGGRTVNAALNDPVQDWAVHNINKMHMTVTNYAILGASLFGAILCDDGPCPNCEYPINSDKDYLFAGAFWIGAIIGSDTLCSIGAEGWSQGVNELLPRRGEAGLIERRSSIPTSLDYNVDAVSEQDFISHMADTITDPALTGTDTFDGRSHIPLNIAMDQSTYAWSYDYAEDFIIYDFKFINIGSFEIKNLYMGVYVDGDVYHTSTGSGWQDDICGFLRTVKVDDPCLDEDTVNIAYIADNDGDPNAAATEWTSTSVQAVTGTKVLRTPNENLSYSFNWWISNGDSRLDFGPRKAGTQDDPFFPFPQGNLGTPNGDRVKYYLLSHPEFDYDQLTTGISHVDEGYLPPPRADLAQNFADGFDTRYLISFGPFNVEVGDTLPITLAYVAGDNFHVNPGDFQNFFDYRFPNIYYDKLSFADFATNARWADWIFDNPGVDTDGDGDSGRYYWRADLRTDTLCSFDADIPPEWPDSAKNIAKKHYYKGDYNGTSGAPDFTGATPPPVPQLTLIPGNGQVTIRWNGQLSENTPDRFSGDLDFEGYKVYMAEGYYGISGIKDEVEDRDFILLTSYDREDYSRYWFTGTVWERTEAPIFIDDLREAYGIDFDPNQYDSPYSSFTDPESGQSMYFEPEDWNESDLTDPTRIHRVYPDALKTDSSDTNDQGFLRYYEYEYVVKDIQPSVPWTFSVTTFDYGSIGGATNLPGQESAKLLNAISDYPMPTANDVERDGLGVIVWPNPYRVDAGYAQSGYENRAGVLAVERARRIHFGNLPNVCTIRIFSIDGDLIREIHHNFPEGGPGSQHEEWDLISRNTQSIATGIYLWHVESEMGEQLGKLVIIK